MSDLSDKHLLTAWAERRDESAFRELLGRYAGFVFGAAVRRVGDAGLAEEIAQDVFAHLSQKAAGLLDHPTLAGWLHRSTMLISLDRLRRRKRHDQNLERYSTMNSTPPRSGDHAWAEVRPHLDEALDQLGVREREMVMLYYVERHTYPEIATRVGASADAVRMRVNRAIETLSSLLRRKGVALPAAAIAAGLGGALTQTAPAALVAPATLAAFSAAGKVPLSSVVIHALHTMKSAKITAVAVFTVAISAPLLIQQQQIAAAEDRIAVLRHSFQPTVASGAEAKSVVPTLPVVSNPPSPAVVDIRQLGLDALDASYNSIRRIRATIARLDNQSLAGLIETVTNGTLLQAQREALLLKLLGELQKRDVALFLECSMKAGSATVPKDSLNDDYPDDLKERAEKAFRQWVAASPQTAEAWGAAHESEWNAFSGSSLASLSLCSLLKAEPPRAHAMLEKLSWEKGIEALQHGRDDLTPEMTVSLAAWAATSVRDEEHRRRLVRKALWFTTTERKKGEPYLDVIRPKLLDLHLNESDLAWVAARLTVDSADDIRWDVDHPIKAEVAWLETTVPPSQLSYAKGAIGHLYQPIQALIYLNAQLDRGADDDLVAGYVESEDLKRHRDVLQTPSGGNHGDTAFRLATRVEDPQRRVALLVRAWKDLNRDEPAAARAILSIPELHPDDRRLVNAQIETLSPRN